MAPRPPSPPLAANYLSARDDSSDWASAFTLLDTFETYFDSHVDLLQRKLQKHSDRLKMKAEVFKMRDFKIRDKISSDVLAENIEREFKNFRLRLSSRMTRLSASWQSAKVVRTREKVSFFFGVMSVLISALLFGMAPQYVHIAYTLQGAYLFPLRVYSYKKRAWHYFLFDLCYFVNILNFIFIWLLPANTALFTACYCLSHGSLASAVITWRNSLVFHDQEKVTSLFIHVYPPFTFTVIRHFYPNAGLRFPALRALPHLQPARALLLSGGIYVIWQLLYWKFVFINRREKIASGQRTTSYSWLLNDKRGRIGKALSSTPPQHREHVFMAGQLVYALLTEIPVVFFFYDSSLCSGIFLIFIFAVSVWNGGGFYIEVFGRKFERELEALRKELAETTARSESFRTSPTNSNSSLPTDSTPPSPREILAMDPSIPPLELDTGSPTVPETKMMTESAIPPLELNSGSPEAPESTKLHTE